MISTALVQKLWHRQPIRRALVLAGGGVIGGMYEVGALAALDESLPGFRANGFDVYVGASAGSVVAALLANGVSPADLYRIIDGAVSDPLNLREDAVYDRLALGAVALRFGKLVWALGKHALTGLRIPFPDLLSRARGAVPAGFFSLDRFEAYMRRTFETKGLANDFRALPRTLLIPAVDLDRAERVVFGVGALDAVPISQAIAASSAIPGFFEPYTIDGRDYVDGGIGDPAHADLAIRAGANLLVVINPLTPTVVQDGGSAGRLKAQGMYSVMDQAGRIASQERLEASLRELAAQHPGIQISCLEPPNNDSALLGPSMGFEASRAALRFGYLSTQQWLAADGAAFGRRFGSARQPTPGTGGTAGLRDIRRRWTALVGDRARSSRDTAPQSA